MGSSFPPQQEQGTDTKQARMDGCRGTEERDTQIKQQVKPYACSSSDPPHHSQLHEPTHHSASSWLGRLRSLPRASYPGMLFPRVCTGHLFHSLNLQALVQKRLY